MYAITRSAIASVRAKQIAPIALDPRAKFLARKILLLLPPPPLAEKGKERRERERKKNQRDPESGPVAISGSARWRLVSRDKRTIFRYIHTLAGDLLAGIRWRAPLRLVGEKALGPARRIASQEDRSTSSSVSCAAPLRFTRFLPVR